MQNMAHKRGESKPRLENKKVFKYFGNQKLCCSNSNGLKLLLLLKAAGLWSFFFQTASSFLNIHSRQTIFLLCPIFCGNNLIQGGCFSMSSSWHKLL